MHKVSNWAARLSIVLRLLRRGGDLPSILCMVSALSTRMAWVEAGITSAGDDEAVARMARRP